jgi:hypothetical protein
MQNLLTNEPREIEKIVQKIIGEPCWGGRLSIGNELRLEFGSKLPNPNLRDKLKGRWRLGASTSKWVLLTGSDLVVSSNDDAMQIKEKISLLNDQYVTEFNINWEDFSAEILFGNQIRLKLSPDLSKRSKVPHWQLFMPDFLLLEVGPGKTWLLCSSKETFK